MKFGKLIQALIDAALPAWKDKFLPYKRLKKRLNALIGEVLADSIRAAGAGPYAHGLPYAVGDVGIGYPAAYGAATMDLYGNDGVHARNGLGGSTTHAMASESQPGGKRGRGPYEEGRGAKRQCLLDESEFKRLLEMEFKRLLEGELDKLNDFVVEKEEEFVIKLQHFKEKVERLKDMMKGNDKNQLDMINLQKDVTVFHGEMVLLENYSSLNYIGLVKIVKKHDRLTGAWLRLSFIPDVLRQPFYSTDILSRLVKDCESNLLSVFPSYSGETADRASFERDTQESVFEDDSLFCEDVIKEIYKNTTAALQTIRNIGKGSSTYNVYSVPPCEDNDDAGSVVDEE